MHHCAVIWSCVSPCVDRANNLVLRALVILSQRNDLQSITDYWLKINSKISLLFNVRVETPLVFSLY